MKLWVGLSVLVSASLVAASLQAQEAGDPARGLTLARQVCAECHSIQAQQLQSPNPRAPTFLQVATTPGMTSTALTVSLTTPHAGMPMFRLTSEQRANIIAYILGLKEAGPAPGR